MRTWKPMKTFKKIALIGIQFGPTTQLAVSIHCLLFGIGSIRNAKINAKTKKKTSFAACLPAACLNLKFWHQF